MQLYRMHIYTCICRQKNKQTVKYQVKIINHVNSKQGSTIVPEQADRETKCSLFFVIDYTLSLLGSI